MRPYALFLFTIAVFTSIQSSGQGDGVKVAAKSRWIESIDYNMAAKPGNAESSSYYYLLWDEQENTVTEEYYVHRAYKILTTEGIQAMADVSFDFDPAYQQLTFHDLKVRRGGTTIDQLPKHINVIQRETSMDRYLYDGSKTAIINLKDIRVGDVVEFSLTRKGFNPVHQGHISRVGYFDFYVAVEKSYQKIILSSSKKFTLKDFGSPPVSATVKTVGNTVHYSWLMEKIKPASYDSNVPSWFEEGNGYFISDYQSWREVGDWAKKLFVISDADRKRIKIEVAPTFASIDDAAYILEVIRFVQDEVRYLGFESGINSHKPYPPFQVYEQRFGDCKDKSLLLATLLQARGIEAYPMLVNTSIKQSLDNRLPAGNIFDHCVVQLNFENEKVYIDPTISNQGGNLKNHSFPDYRRGLVIDEEISGLDTLPQLEMPTTSEVQNFEVLTIGGEAMLTIQTTYTGSDADYQRGEFASKPIQSFQNDYRNFYANLYPSITQWDSLTFVDDREKNVIIVNEKYKIPTFWKPVEKQEGQISSVVQHQSITNYFNVSKNIVGRQSPYYLTYPVDFSHTINISMPEEWSITNESEVIDNDFYRCEYSVVKNGREISRKMRYQTKVDHIPADKIQQYVDDQSTMYNKVAYEFTYNTKLNAASKSPAGLITMVIAAVCGIYGMFVLYHRYDPKPDRYMVLGSPIGGWLVLIGIGLCVTPLRMVYDFSVRPDLITGAAWMSWYASEDYKHFAFEFAVHVYNIFRLLLCLLLLVLFFQRRTSFPRLMSIHIALYLSMTLASAVVAYSDGLESSKYLLGVVQALIATCIWIPYLNISQRVKETFIVRVIPNDDDDLEAQSEMVSSDAGKVSV